MNDQELQKVLDFIKGETQKVYKGWEKDIQNGRDSEDSVIEFRIDPKTGEKIPFFTRDHELNNNQVAAVSGAAAIAGFAPAATAAASTVLVPKVDEQPNSTVYNPEDNRGNNRTVLVSYGLDSNDTTVLVPKAPTSDDNTVRVPDNPESVHKVHLSPNEHLELRDLISRRPPYAPDAEKSSEIIAAYQKAQGAHCASSQRLNKLKAQVASYDGNPFKNLLPGYKKAVEQLNKVWGPYNDTKAQLTATRSDDDEAKRQVKARLNFERLPDRQLVASYQQALADPTFAKERNGVLQAVNTFKTWLKYAPKYDTESNLDPDDIQVAFDHYLATGQVPSVVLTTLAQDIEQINIQLAEDIDGGELAA